jgi:accessory Sec system S-layer assembly protein
MALFKKKEKTAEVIEENSLESVQGAGLADAESGLVKTSLVYHPDWGLSNQEKYVYMFKHQQLPLLKENQLSIKGLRLLQYDDGFVVVAFLRNTLAKSIRFESITLLLLDENGTALAKKQFELDSIGEMPPLSCMPWRFLFENEDKLVDTIPEEGWSVAFEIKQLANAPQQLDLEESWEKELSPLDKEQLEKVMANLPALAPNEVNIMGLEAKHTAEGNFVTTVLFRNGGHQDLQFEQLPLVVEDAAGEVICKGGFTLKDFKVKANTTKPWTFIFPKELLLKESPDLSKWKVYFPNNKAE